MLCVYTSISISTHTHTHTHTLSHTAHTQVVGLQTTVQEQRDAQATAAMHAAASEGALRLSAQGAQSRVHHLEAVVQQLRQALAAAAAGVRDVVQEVWSRSRYVPVHHIRHTCILYIHMCMYVHVDIDI